MRTWCGGSSPATERYIQPSKDFGGQLAQVTTAAAGARFYLADLNDNIGLLAARASAIDSHTFEAFGVPVSGGTPTVQPFGYGGDAGYYTEPIGGLPILWNRIYDTNVGQFPSRDPAWPFGGDNMYAFVGNNPLRWQDPMGLWPNLCCMFKLKACCDDQVNDGLVAMFETMLQEILNDACHGGAAQIVQQLSNLKSINDCKEATSDLSDLTHAINLFKGDPTSGNCIDICLAFNAIINNCLSAVGSDTGNALEVVFPNYCASRCTQIGG